MECVLSQLNGYVRWLGQYAPNLTMNRLLAGFDHGQCQACFSKHGASDVITFNFCACKLALKSLALPIRLNRHQMNRH